MNALILIGCILLPFSTSPDAGFVFSFGLPFFFLHILVSLPLFSNKRIVDYPGILSLPTFVILIMSASTLLSPNIDQSAARLFVNIAGYLIFISLFHRIRNNIIAATSIETAVTSFGVTLALYYIVNLTVKSIEFGFGAVILERWTGGLASLPWGASNTISAVLVFPIVMALAGFERHKESSKGTLYLLAILVIAFGMLCTLSRTAVLVLLLLFAARAFILRKLSFKSLFLLVATGGALSGILYLWGLNSFESLETILSDRFSDERIQSGNGRTDSWMEKIDYFLQNPVDPVGYYGSLHAFNGFTAHNYFITTLVEQSFIGLLINLAFIISPFLAYKKLNKADGPTSAKWYLVGIFLMTVNLSFEDANFSQPFILIFWICMAMTYGLIFARQASRRESEVQLAG